MADSNTSDEKSPSSNRPKINLDEFKSIKKVNVPDHMQSLSQSSTTEDHDNIMAYSPRFTFDSDDSHPLQEEPSLELSDFDGAEDMEELNFIEVEVEDPKNKHAGNIVDNLDAYGYGPNPPTLSLIEFEALEKQVFSEESESHGTGSQKSPRNRRMAEYLRGQGVMYEDDFDDNSANVENLKEQGVMVSDSDDEGTIKGDDLQSQGVLPEDFDGVLQSGSTPEGLIDEDEFDEFGVMKEPGQTRNYGQSANNAPRASPSAHGHVDMMKYFAKTPKEEVEHKPISLSQDTYTSDVIDIDAKQTDHVVPDDSSGSHLPESSGEQDYQGNLSIEVPSDNSQKEKERAKEIENSPQSSFEVSSLSKQTFPEYSSVSDSTKEEVAANVEEGNNSDLNNTSETVINLSDILDSPPKSDSNKKSDKVKEDKQGAVTFETSTPETTVKGKPPKSVGPPIKRSTPKNEKEDNGTSKVSGRTTPQKSGRITPSKSGRTTPKSGRATPQSGRTTPLKSGRTTPGGGGNGKSTGGRNTPSKGGRETPSGKNGRVTPKSGRVTPSAKSETSGRTTPLKKRGESPSRIPVPKVSLSGRSTPVGNQDKHGQYQSDDDKDPSSQLSSVRSRFTSESPMSSQNDNFGESSVCSTDWENMSDHSKHDLTTRLRREASSRRQADELIGQLQQDYDDLLQKYALAEVTIDQLRLGAKITLETNPPLPGQSSSGTLSKAQQPQTINMGQIGQARMSPAPQMAMYSDAATGVRGDPLSASQTTVNSLGSNNPKTTDIDENDPVLQAVTSAESMAMGLRFQAKSLEEQMESFQSLMEESPLSPEDQKQLFDRLKVQHEQLERDYLHAKEEQNTIRRKNNLISGNFNETFDSEKEIEGEIFRLGMKLEDIQEKVQETLKSQPPEDNIGKNDAFLATVDPDLARRKQHLTQEYRALLDRYDQLKRMARTPDRDRELDDMVEQLRNLHNENPDIFGHELPEHIQDGESADQSGILPDRFFSASNPSLYHGGRDTGSIYSPLSAPAMYTPQGDPIYHSDDSLQGSPDSSPELDRRGNTGYGSGGIPLWYGRDSPSPSSSPEMVRKSQQHQARQQYGRPADSGRSTPSISRHPQTTTDFGRSQKYPGQRPVEGDVDSGFVGSEGSRYSNQSSLQGYGGLGKDRTSYAYTSPSPISQHPSSLYSRRSSAASTVRGHRASVTSQSHRWTESEMEDDMSYTTGNGRSVKSLDTVDRSSKRATPVKTRKSPVSNVDVTRQRRPLSGRSRDSNGSTRMTYYTTDDDDLRQDTLKQRILRDKEAERWADPTNKRDKFDTASMVSRSSVKSEAIRALHDEVQKLRNEMNASKRAEERAKYPPLEEEMQARAYEMPPFERPLYERERAVSTPYNIDKYAEDKVSPGYQRTQSLRNVSRSHDSIPSEFSRLQKSPQGYSRQLFGSDVDAGQRSGVEGGRAKYETPRPSRSGSRASVKDQRGQTSGRPSSRLDRSDDGYERGRTGYERGHPNSARQRNSGNSKQSRREEMLRALRDDVQHLREQIVKKYNPKYRRDVGTSMPYASTPYNAAPIRGAPVRVQRSTSPMRSASPMRSTSPMRSASPVRQPQPRVYPSPGYGDERQDYDRNYSGYDRGYDREYDRGHDRGYDRRRDPYPEDDYMDERPYTAYDSPYVDAYRSRPVSPVGRPLSPRQRSMSMPSFSFAAQPCPLCGGAGIHTHSEYTYPSDNLREQQSSLQQPPPPPQPSYGLPQTSFASPPRPQTPQYASTPVLPSYMTRGAAQSMPSIPTALGAQPGYHPQQGQPQAPSGSTYVLAQPATGTVDPAAQPSQPSPQQAPIQIISQTPVRHYTSATKKGKVKYFTQSLDDAETASEEEIIYRRTSPRREARRRTKNYHEDRAAKIETIRLGLSVEDAIRTAQELKRKSRKMLSTVRADVVQAEMYGD